MRRAARTDQNQREIVDALRRIGASVELLHCQGGGCPDLLVALNGHTVLMECKSDEANPRLRESQRKWMAGWQGEAVVVCTPTQAVAVMRAQ